MEADYKKITQLLNWLAKKEGGEINRMKAIKLIWMADRLHLREYGRTITNDDYVAMKNGPVGSVTRDIVDQAASYLSDEQLGYSQKYIDKASDFKFKSIEDIEIKVLSASEVEALELIYEGFGKFSQFDLRDLTHEFPEWKKFKEKFDRWGSGREAVSNEDFFKNPESPNPLLDGKFSAVKTIFNQDEDKLEKSKSLFTELREVEDLWG